MSTYQDAISNMETSGVWVASERTALANIYTEIGTEAVSQEWTNYCVVMGEAKTLIAEVSVPTYGKQPEALTDTEIMEIRNELSNETLKAVLYKFANLMVIRKIITATWNIAENQYDFVLETADTDVDMLNQPAIISYSTGAGMPKVFPTIAACHKTYDWDFVAMLDSAMLPDLVVEGMLYGWFLTSDATGAMLKAGETLLLQQEPADYGMHTAGTVYAGIAKEEVTVQMRTKQLINGVTKEFVVYPKTLGGGGGGGESNMIMWDEQSETEIGNAIMEKLVAGVSPVIWRVGTGLVFYPMNLTENDLLFASWEVDPPTGVTSNWINLTKDGDEWRLMGVTATWSATFQEA